MYRLDSILLPPNERHQCPHCGKVAQGLTKIVARFGLRRPGRHLREQSWCRTCRSQRQKGKPPTPRLHAAASSPKSRKKKATGDPILRKMRVPANEEHTCPCCGKRAKGLTKLTAVFGWRLETELYKIQSWCRECRIEHAKHEAS